MSGMVRRARRATAAGVVGVFAFAAVACTTGGGEDEVKSDDGGDAAAAIAGAVEEARATSGRFHTTYVATDDYGEGPDTQEWSLTGEFSPGAARSTVEATGDDSEDDGTSVDLDASTLEVDDHSYASASSLDPLRELYKDDPVESEELDPSDLVDDELFDPKYDFAVLDGKEWVETTALDETLPEEEQPVDMMVRLSLRSFLADDPFHLLEVVENVAEVDGTDVNGVAARHFTAEVPATDLESLLYDESFVGEVESGDEEADESPEALEYEARYEAVQDYVRKRISVQADLYLDEHDQLLRVEVVADLDVEDQYLDCEVMGARDSSLTITTDFSDVGGDIVIAAPDPAVVVTSAQLAAAFPNRFTGSDDTSFIESEPVLLETVDGPRDRDDVINDLMKFGDVIGLSVDGFAASDEESNASATLIWELSDEDLVAKYNEVDAVLATLPRTTTPMGDLTRPELLWNVKWGLRNVDMDPAQADALTDEELGALISSYMEQTGGAAGDGVWGDMSEDAYDVSPGDGPGPELFPEDEFEGCPG